MEYKKLNGLEALEREFEQLTKMVRPTGKSGPGFFSASAAPRPANIPPQLFDYEGDVHALIGAKVDRGNPSVCWYDVGDKPKVSPDNEQALIQKFIEACHTQDDWHAHFNDHRLDELKAFAAWTAASVDERPAQPPKTIPKTSLDQRLEDAKEFVERTITGPTLKI